MSYLRPVFVNVYGAQESILPSYVASPYFKTCRGTRNRFQEMNSASLCSLAGRYDNPLPPRFLAPIDSLKIQCGPVHHNSPPGSLKKVYKFGRPRICKHFKGFRNRFSHWRTGPPELILWHGPNNYKDVERPDPKGLFTFSQCTSSCRAEDSKSCPPDLKLGSLTKWLASRC